MTSHSEKKVKWTKPGSDVVSVSHPYVLSVRVRGAAKPGARAGIRLTRKAGDGAALSGSVSVRLGKPDARGLRTGCLSIDAKNLAPGEYSGEAALAGQMKPFRFSFFRMPENSEPIAPFGIYAMGTPSTDPERDAMLRDLQSLGINLLSPHMNGLGAESKLFDRAARFGMRFRPSMRYWSAANNHADKKEMVTRFPAITQEGTPSQRFQGVCRNRKEVREWAAGNVERHLREYATHAAFDRSVYFGDDLFLSFAASEAKASISCYCDYCTAEFKKIAGIEPPAATEEKTGIIRDDDPWLLWMRHRCAKQYAGFIESIEASKNKVDPSVEIGLCHGWPDNPFTSIVSGLYGPLTQRTGAVSSYCYPFLRSPASEFIVHYEIGRMGNRNKDEWMLGLLHADNTAAPPWQVRQNYWNMLAAGYKTIAFFTWYGTPEALASPDADKRRRFLDGIEALRECGSHKEWVLPSARLWKLPRAPYALLFSFTTEAFDIAPRFRGHLHTKRIASFYRRALAAGVPMDIISEEEVKDGMLDRYEAVCLHDVRALSYGAADALDKYARKGKPVLVDADLLYTDGWHVNQIVSIRGEDKVDRRGEELAPESMIAVLADRMKRPVVSSNADSTVRRFVNGDTEHLVVVNNYPDRYSGMPYEYSEPAKNYSRAERVRDLPIDTELTFSEAGRTLFDAATGEPLGDTGAPLPLRLAPSWGIVLVSLPCVRAVPALEAPASARLGDTVRCRLSMLNEKGKRIRGVFTVRVEITTPSGAASPLGCFVGLEDGRADFLLPLGINDETGIWRLRAEGGFPRRHVECEIRVSAGSKKKTGWLRPLRAEG